MDFAPHIEQQGNEIIAKYNGNYEDISMYLVDAFMWLKINCFDYPETQRQRSELKQIERYIYSKMGWNL